MTAVFLNCDIGVIKKCPGISEEISGYFFSRNGVCQDILRRNSAQITAVATATFSDSLVLCPCG